MSATFDVVPVVDWDDDIHEDTHRVQTSLTLEARRRALRQIARAVVIASGRSTPILATLYAAGAVEIDDSQHQALTRLDHLLGEQWATWPLDADEATGLGNALLDAAEKPPACVVCGHLIDTDTPGDECRICVDTPKGRRAS